MYSLPVCLQILKMPLVMRLFWKNVYVILISLFYSNILICVLLFPFSCATDVPADIPDDT